MQLTIRCALGMLLALSSAVDGAGLRPPGRAGGKPCDVQPVVCNVTTPVFAFGRHSLTQTTDPIYAQGSITVSCEKILLPNVPMILTLELSGIPADDPRELASEQPARLEYNLYLDAVRTRVWGDGSRGTEIISDSLLMPGGTRDVSKTYVLYGRVNGGQAATGGNYANAITAEMRYGITCN